MKAGWWVAVATGMALGAAPVDVFAQGASQRARAEQRAEQRRQAEQQRAEQRRQAEQQRAEQRRQAEQQRAEQRRQVERERPANQRRAAPVRGVIVERPRTAERPRTVDRNDRRDDRDRYDRRATHTNPQYGVMRPQPRASDRGPAFCRSGTGHPVFGTRWCLDKGFSLGNDRYDRYDRYDDRYDRYDDRYDERDYDIWRDIVLRQPRDRRYDRALNRAMLQQVLGAVMLNQFEVFARQYGSGEMTGYWLDGGGSILQLQLGSMPIARLTDSDRDGRVDSVQLRR